MIVDLVCIAKSEDRYISEWINYHTSLGFDNIHIYKNDWDYNINKKHVIEIPISGRNKQVIAYNHYLNNSRSDWAAFIDIDEFIVIKSFNNIKSFIKSIGTGHTSIVMNWMIFGDSKSDLDKYDYVIDRFNMRSKTPNEHVKSIIKVGTGLFTSNPHCTDGQWIDSNNKTGYGPFNKNGPTDQICVNHYFTKTRSEFIDKIKRGPGDMSNSRNFNQFDCHNQNDIVDNSALMCASNNIFMTG